MNAELPPFKNGNTFPKARIIDGMLYHFAIMALMLTDRGEKLHPEPFIYLLSVLSIYRLV